MGNKWYLFLYRISFISNILFIVCLLLRYTHLALPETITGFVLIIGWIPVSPLLNLCCAANEIVFLVRRKKEPAMVWLRLINTLFLLAQTYYFIAIYR